jgi:uncharacterized protein (TIGR03067 family)
MKCTCAAVIAFVACLNSGGDNPTKQDLLKMEGEWHVTKNITNGSELTDKQIKEADIKLVVKDAKYTVYFGGMKITEGTVKLDATKSPRELDAVADDGKAMKGVYKYDGDELVVNFSQPGQDRPADFTCKEGSNCILLHYKRAKK